MILLRLTARSLWHRRTTALLTLITTGKYKRLLADHLPCGNIYDVLWEGHETNACERLKDELGL